MTTFDWIDLRKVKKATVCLGPAGTFSEIAARHWAKEKGIKANIVLCKDIPEVVSNVRERKTTLGIVPIYNIYEGDVHKAIDAIIDEEKVHIVDEIYEKIIHNLIGTKKIKFSKIKKVISHPQALSQCQNWLNRNLPKAKKVEVKSTAEAVMKLSKRKPWVAIGSKEAIREGQVILAENIQDLPQNITRFLVISILPRLEELTGPVKNTICFRIPHQPGALVRALLPIAEAKFNIIWINERPDKTDTGEVIFWIDVETNSTKDDVRFKEALKIMRKEGQVISFSRLDYYPLRGRQF